MAGQTLLPPPARLCAHRQPSCGTSRRKARAAASPLLQSGVRTVGALRYGAGLEIDMGEALGMIETRGQVAMIEADAARRVGEVIAVHVIPRPHESLEGVLPIGKPQTHTAGN